MSRILAIAIAAVACVAPASALAQQTYGPTEGFEGDEETPVPIAEETPCESQPQEDGVILVCRDLPDSQQYRTSLPRPTRSDRRIIPGLTDPPCWVTNPSAVGTLSCMRMGWAPEPALMVDVTAFPEELSAEEAALVSATGTDGAATDSEAPAIGQRVPIDLSQDD